MWNAYDLISLKERYNNLLREAETRQIIRELKAARPRRHFYAPALAQLGLWLIDWGSQLRSRYDTAELSIESSANSSSH